MVIVSGAYCLKWGDRGEFDKETIYFLMKIDRVKDVKPLQVGNVGIVCHSSTVGLRENMILQPPE